VSRLVADALNGRRQVLVRNNQAVAAIVNITELDRLQRVEGWRATSGCCRFALARAAADCGRRYEPDEVAEELGIDPSELTES
jgi:hypothetical protein